LKKIKIACIIVAVTVLFAALAACGGGGGGGGAAQTTAAATEKPTTTTAKPAETTEKPAETTAASEAKSDDWRTPYEQTVKVTISNNDGKDGVFAEGEDIFNNLWTKRWKKLYNIEVETIWGSAEYKIKTNLAIASRELPDMFFCDPVQFQQLLDADLLYDLTDVYNKYVYEPVKQRYESDMLAFDTCWRNGKLYSVPQLYYGRHEAQALWIKNNWYKEAGSPEIKLLSQFEDLMRTFMKDHDKKFAMPLNNKLDTFYNMTPTWHVFHEIWLDDGNGGCKYGDIQPEMKNMLETWARWYKEGLLRSDGVTLEWDVMMADVINGEVGVLPAHNYAGWWWGKDIYQLYGEEALLSSYEFPSVDGETVMYPFKFLQQYYNVCSKSCKNPEVLIKLNNDYFYVQNIAVKVGDMTIEEQLPFGAGNMHHMTGPFKLCHDEDKDIVEVWPAVNNNVKDPVFSTGYGINYYNEIMKWVNYRDPVSLGRYLQMGSPDAPIYRAYLFYEQGRYVYTKLWGPQPEVLDDLGEVLKEIMNEGFAKIITGIEPIDYFETLVDEWLKAGGAEVTKAVSEMYGGK